MCRHDVLAVATNQCYAPSISLAKHFEAPNVCCKVVLGIGIAFQMTHGQCGLDHYEIKLATSLRFTACSCHAIQSHGKAVGRPLHEKKPTCAKKSRKLI
jgi:hypothetical protein